MERGHFTGLGDRPLRLAMLGMVDGNGHPYSWSAIFNGYDRAKMAECPYAGIPAYLNAEPDEALGIPGAKVTHVWTDDPDDAPRVAEASLIPNIVGRPEEVIGHVDAVIVATDKGHEHVERCRPFIEAGLPIFVDKPLVDRAEDLAVFRGWVAEGHAILSGSALSYAREFAPFHRATRENGDSTRLKRKRGLYQASDAGARRDCTRLSMQHNLSENGDCTKRATQERDGTVPVFRGLCNEDGTLPVFRLGELRYASVTTAKSWERYGIHALSAVYPILGPGFVSARNTGTVERGVVHFKHRNGVDLVVAAIQDMYGGFGCLQLCGTKASAQVQFQDTFFAFKAQLVDFVRYLRTGERPFPWSETEELMKMVIAGIESREQGGREITL